MIDLFRNLAITAAEATAAAGNTPTAAAPGEVDASVGWLGMIGPLLSLLLMFGLMYFIMIRPQRKKEKQTKAMLDALKKGDRICTIGGIYGTIVSIKDDTVTLAVGSEKTEMVMARWAIRSVEDVSVENEGELLN